LRTVEQKVRRAMQCEVSRQRPLWSNVPRCTRCCHSPPLPSDLRQRHVARWMAAVYWLYLAAVVWHRAA
jgi:hypothetical protein